MEVTISHGPIEYQNFSSYKELKATMLKALIEKMSNEPFNEINGNRLTIHSIPDDPDRVMVKWDDTIIGNLELGFSSDWSESLLAYPRKFTAKFTPVNFHNGG